MKDMRKFKYFFALLKVCGFASSLLLGNVGCSVKAFKKAPEDQVALYGGVIRIGQTVEYSSEAKPNSNSPEPYTHSTSTVYKLEVEEKLDIIIREQGRSLACLNGSEGVGPFVTIVLNEDQEITSDLVRSPKFAVTNTDFTATLDKGTFDVTVNFYANGKGCAATLQFLFDKTESIPDEVNPKDPIPDGGNGTPIGPGDDNGDVDGGTPFPAVDPELFGFWKRKLTPDSSTSLQTLEISNAGKITEILSDDTFIILDQDLQIAMKELSNFTRFEMVVLGVKVNESGEQRNAGDTQKCIYEIKQEPKSLYLKCSPAGSPNYPANLYEALIFLGGGAAISSQLTDLNLPIPDNNPVGISQPILVEDDVEIKDIEVSLQVSHIFRGDVKVSLVNPEGQEVLLFKNSGDLKHDIDETFSIRTDDALRNLRMFLNGRSKGKWVLKLVDQYDNHVGKLNSFGLKIYYYL
jgi:subtilisin-like proprotein convertase family protein